jgi:hypothetical protein
MACAAAGAVLAMMKKPVAAASILMTHAFSVGAAFGKPAALRRQSDCAVRKRFFFEKKNQKTFRHEARVAGRDRSQAFKSFLLLFFKKEDLAFLD